MGWVIEGKLYSDYIYVVGKWFEGKWIVFWISGNVSVDSWVSEGKKL